MAQPLPKEVRPVIGVEVTQLHTIVVPMTRSENPLIYAAASYQRTRGVPSDKFDARHLGSRWPSSKVSPRAPGPIPLKNRSVLRLFHVNSYARNQTSSCWYGAEAWRKGCQLRCRPRHLTAVQNYEVRPKIALALLQKGT
ncbi:hypothetical protein AVEN_4585-1 [Araneus ventricosus]|uniref:Uncharacterized protein n=1 Tax=Araneus ventricosus TaxID=182803 RepID=A0A4Y2UXV0_ARAVE|nr:hypothetical protein AVEN_51206-1 [Araneus ventricosus]GBO17092.1 hypothetical protein AVEN_4585-1 [Araneus ventricosus]